jgi:pimeloyl-ACP methyl ester carboxylesterase
MLLLTLFRPAASFPFRNNRFQLQHSHHARSISISSGGRSRSTYFRYSSSCSSSDDSSKETAPVHLVVLVHGWLGNELEMGYLQQSLERQSGAKGHQVMIHSAVSNVGRTWDGIAAGGLRLAQEIDRVVDEMQQESASPSTSSICISLSLVGNSLGGLYARHALGHLSSFSKLQPNLFCTTATPHLGVSKHTYVKIPRVAEYLIANSMQPTGRDLFRFTNALDTLYESQYLKPLAAFTKRVAVANAYGTDFQVPTATAAFLASTNSPHYQVVVDDKNKETANFEVLTVETPITYRYDASNEGGNGDSDWGDSPVPLSILATRLDSLGWQKIFCDVREHLPTVYRRARDPLSMKPCWTSQQLLDSLCDSGLSLPLGHTVLVANSKSKLYEYLNRGGQPIMDRLASTILQEITSTTTPRVATNVSSKRAG